MFRETNEHRTHLSKKVGSIPIHTFFKKCEPPSIEEGFAEIYSVNLVLQYENDNDEAFYNMVH